MNTLYDLLGIRPSDNAETIRAAFRKAAKANHPDLHAGDPSAAVRFRQIAQAYEILRDAERRAIYDRLLQSKRQRVGWRVKSLASYLMRSVVSDAVTAIGLAIALAGGYTIYAHISKTPAEELAGTGGRGSPRVQPAGPANTNKPGERREGPERSAGPDMIVPNNVASAPIHALASEPTPGGSVPRAAALNAEAANIVNTFAVTMDRAGPKSEAERSDQIAGTEKRDQDSAQSVKALSSSRESSNASGEALSSDFVISAGTRDMTRSRTQDINASEADIADTRLPETKAAPKARIAAKRQPARRATFEQASLESRNACSGSCLRDVPPLFGVGF